MNKYFMVKIFWGE